MIRVEVLSILVDGVGVGMGISGWEVFGVCDVACEPAPRAIFAGFLLM